MVDDEADAREFLAAMFSRCDAEVRIAVDGLQALQTLAQWTPDLIVSDIGMADMDGYELMRKVRLLSVTKGGAIPAIALTAYAHEDDRSRAFAAGFHGHLAKPVDPTELFALVVKLTRKPTNAPSR